MSKLKRLLTRSLRFRFLMIMSSLAIAPLLLAAIIIGRQTYANLETQSIELQAEVAAGIGSQLQSTLFGREAELAMLDEVVGVQLAPPHRQHSVLQNLLASQHMYQEIAFVDAAGPERVRVSRDSAVLPMDLMNRANDPSLQAVLETGDTYFGPVEFNREVREPLTTIGYPLLDRRTGEIRAALIASVRFMPMWELLGSLDNADGGDAFLTTADGRVVAHADPSVVLRNTRYQLPDSNGISTGLDGSEVAVATVDVALGDQQLVVVAEQPLSVASAAASRNTRIVAVVMAAALAAVAGLVVAGSRLFVVPIEKLAATAHLVGSGDLTARAAVQSGDEIGGLADEFNRMVGQLQGLVGNLERRVDERTADLKDATRRQAELIEQLEARNEALTQVHAQLEETVRSKDEFLGSVSHELRTPLSSVLGFSSMLVQNGDTLTADERREFCERIADQGQDMANIINDLLVAARADSGDIPVDLVPFDLTEDVRRVIEDLSEDRVRLRSSGSPAMALADPGRVRQILRNLIVNADRYGGPSVEVAVGLQNGHAVVEVRDDGVGIPEAEWETIFDPYHRSHHRTGQPASVGLGLTVSRMLARRMDGDLTYRYADGTSVFELVLPGARV